MEIWEFLLVFALGLATHVVFLRMVEKRALSMVRQAASNRGNQMKTEYQDDLMSLLGEVKIAHDEWKAGGGTEPMDFAKTHLVGIAARHPRTVARYGKKLYELFKSGDFANFEGLAE